MDIKRTSTPHKSKKWLLPLAVGLLVLILWQLFQPQASAKVNLKEVWLGQVQYGDLIAEIEGFGTLQSKYQRLITAEVNATVEEIVLKPGADVKSGDVILRLVNPDLAQQLNNQKIEVERQKANHRQTELNHKRELLALEASLATLNAQYQSAKIELAAQTRLAKKGIVSDIELQRSRLNTEQYQQRYSIEKRRLAQLKQVHTEALNIQQELIKQHLGELATMQRRFDNLTVRASNNGVLQRLPVELGQSVSAGSQLALIGSVNELVALVNISQAQISNVAMGQIATVNVRENVIKGEVLRIDPAVTNGTVTVEISLVDVMPESARPEMNIEAHINTGTLKNTLFIERPSNIRANSQTSLFVINTKQPNAHQTAVRFGTQAGKYIQIIAGAAESDQIILSDTSHLQQHQSIMLIK